MKNDIDEIDLSEYVDVDVSCMISRADLLELVQDRKPIVSNNTKFIWQETLNKMDKEKLIKVCIELLEETDCNLGPDGELICPWN